MNAQVSEDSARGLPYQKNSWWRNLLSRVKKNMLRNQCGLEKYSGLNALTGSTGLTG